MEDSITDEPLRYKQAKLHYLNVRSTAEDNPIIYRTAYTSFCFGPDARVMSRRYDRSVSRFHGLNFFKLRDEEREELILRQVPHLVILVSETPPLEEGDAETAKSIKEMEQMLETI